ncbi:hypothetical protein BO94DRAFT_32128, partial [Aspergillus sclerotioniger CBS 115572]
WVLAIECKRYSVAIRGHHKCLDDTSITDNHATISRAYCWRTVLRGGIRSGQPGPAGNRWPRRESRPGGVSGYAGSTLSHGLSVACSKAVSGLQSSHLSVAAQPHPCKFRCTRHNNRASCVQQPAYHDKAVPEETRGVLCIPAQRGSRPTTLEERSEKGSPLALILDREAIR